MKVLSIQEPYVSLISKGLKFIETRSWKTNYRGEILIHASLGKKSMKNIDNPDVIKLIDDIQMMYGKIVCSANIVDCVLMDEIFINQIKKNHIEYILGIYEIGRYAWILENIKLLNEPIKAKGKLNLWDYELMEEL